MVASARPAFVFQLLLLALLAVSSFRPNAAGAADDDVPRQSSITPINTATFTTPELTVTPSGITPSTATIPLVKTRPSGSRRVGNLCSTGKGMRCHAKVLLATDYTTTDAPEAAAALKLAFHPDATQIGPNNKPASIPASGSGTGRRLLQGSNPAYKPAQLQKVYLAGKSPTKCQTVAIVGAYAYPAAQSDLNYYRSYFGLPALTVTMYDQAGNPLRTTAGTGYVSYDAGWAGEQMLDLSMVSAMCPCCPIMYVASRDAGSNNLYAAIKTAVSKGARVVSMSWGGSDGDGDAADRSNFAFSGSSGVVFAVSSGDNGFAGGVEYPTSSAYVVSVGGTTLRVDSNNNRLTETSWAGAGSGCSKYITKPSWQGDTGCAKRMVSDVSAVADPNTGVMVYFKGQFYIYGGTSASAPIIAAMYGGGYLGATSLSSPAQGLYPGGQDYSSLFDVKAGTNGPCSGYSSYFCNGVSGYDGPTGNGSPTSIGSGGTVPTPNPTPTPSPTPTPTPTPSPSDGTIIRNLHFITGYDSSGNYLCYAIQNSMLVQAVCNTAAASQTFNLYATTGGWYFVKPANTLSQNGCVTLNGSSAGSNLLVQTCNGGSKQAFGFFDFSSNNVYFHLRPRYNNNLCLAVTGGSSRSGTLIQANTCSSNVAQTLMAYYA